MSSSTSLLASWSVDYASIASTSKHVAAQGSATIPNPPGFVRSDVGGGGVGSSSSKKSSKVTERQGPSKEEVEALRSRRAWDVATAPAKSIPMQGFMLYMSGSGVQIFSMMVVGMLLTNPLKAIASIGTSFAPYATPGKPGALLPQQVAFVVCQLACMGLGIYKCWSMGLLPTASSDWLAWREPRVPLEYSPMYP